MPQPYPTTCPKCRTIAGWPVRAQTMAQLTAIRVEVRCRECRHQWAEDLVDAKSLDIGLDAIARGAARAASTLKH